MRKRKELLSWYKMLDNKKMPEYVKAKDVGGILMFIGRVYRYMPNTWALFRKHGEWKYVETDSTVGYVRHIAPFKTEAEAVAYAYNRLNMLYMELQKYTPEAIISDYLQKHHHYLHIDAERFIRELSRHDDIFEEFYTLARIGIFCKRDGLPVKICGYTAKSILEDNKMSIPTAYMYMIRLREDPGKAIADLEARKSPK